MTRVVLATNNAKKLAELRRVLEPIIPGISVLGLGDLPAYDEPAETEPTFEGNAFIKARACVAATGLPALADDSGLCVDALNGMPGVLSSRWAGVSSDAGADEANVALLLKQLADVPDDRRGAHFNCTVAFVSPSGAELVESGKMYGQILREPTGNGGFGYDPVFVASGHDRAVAELTASQKDAVSHRGAALRAIAPQLAQWL